ncbi:hypothetical protein GCK72_003116 [Caenorhabditis remanei]|uniref:Sdz-33 F-box domain-containing protein n=1 Tax=Caenorhabditis remanei TaxID=31234 RepID=A0A6A5HSX6_CAERE|nr:hypothetical protein GCK72_003116 [Caenorhabditis remanei]KAF1771290.1 hypothetical protein GCK72_003116 [Caenorhabditis remanei]
MVSPRNVVDLPFPDSIYTSHYSLSFLLIPPHPSLSMDVLPVLRLPQLVLCEVIKSLNIERRSKDEKLLWKRIISNFWQVEDLRIFSVANSGFIPVFTSWPQKINIRNSYWFTLETILACTSTTILLGRSRLENKDLDVILRKWKAGGFLTLKRLTIDSRNFTGDGEQI